MCVVPVMSGFSWVARQLFLTCTVGLICVIQEMNVMLPPFQRICPVEAEQLISLRPDSCLCKACFADCLRRRPGDRPRWQKQLHCIVCDQMSGANCDCSSVWFRMSHIRPCTSPQVWKLFFGLRCEVSPNTLICEHHFQLITTSLESQQCKICLRCGDIDSKWELVRERADKLSFLFSDGEGGEAIQFSPVDWLCGSCVGIYLTGRQLDVAGDLVSFP